MTASEDAGLKPVRLDPASSPESIESRSFAIIDAETGPERPFAGRAWQVARRLIHTSGDIALLPCLHLPDAAVDAGVLALQNGSPVFTDTEMARAGMPLRRLSPLGVRVSCLLSQPGLAQAAAARKITRARAGIEALGKNLGGAVLAVGNAPTALLALLDYLDGGGPPPALVIGMPVGFVNAEEAKELLLRRTGIHCLVVRGRRGGSPLAAAAVNALACIARQDPRQDFPDSPCPRLP